MPALAVRLDDESSRALDAQHRHPLVRDRELNGGEGLVDDVGIHPVESYDESLRALVLDYAAVAQVHPEEVAVRPGIGRSPSHEHMFAHRSDGKARIRRPGGTGPMVRMAVSKTAGWGSIPWSPA